jgi:hypothetical protein
MVGTRLDVDASTSRTIEPFWREEEAPLTVPLSPLLPLAHSLLDSHKIAQTAQTAPSFNQVSAAALLFINVLLSISNIDSSTDVYASGMGLVEEDRPPPSTVPEYSTARGNRHTQNLQKCPDNIHEVIILDCSISS